MKILILGASGMLGSTLFGYFGRSKDIQVVGQVRDNRLIDVLEKTEDQEIRVEPNIVNPIRLITVLEEIRPDIVINCIDIIKQLHNAKDPLIGAYQINRVSGHTVTS